MSPEKSQRQEYVTIMGSSVAEVMSQFRSRGLDRDGYSITGKVGRHQFCMVASNGDAELFSASGMIAATFGRSVSE